MALAEVTIFSMKKLLLLLAALTAFNAFADDANEIRAAIPESEGAIVFIGSGGNLYRSVDSPSILSGISRNPIFGLGATLGNTVLTNTGVLFVSDGDWRILKKIALNDVIKVQTSSWGRTKGLYIQARDYDATLFTMTSESQEAFVKALTATGFKITEY